MDSGSDEESIIYRRPLKSTYRSVIDSDTESNTSNQSSSESGDTTPAKQKTKKAARRVLDSDTDSENEEQDSDRTEDSKANEETINSVSNASYGSDIDLDDDEHESDGNEDIDTDGKIVNIGSTPAIEDQSRRHHEPDDVSAQLANMSIANKHEDAESVISESEDEIESSLIQPHNGYINESDHDEESEAEQEEQRECFSPRTRRSITGRRPKGFLSTTDESDNDDDDDDEEVPGSPAYQYQENTTISAHDVSDGTQIVRGRKLFQSLLSSESVSTTPEQTRPIFQRDVKSSMATPASSNHDFTINDRSVLATTSTPSASKSICELNSTNDKSSAVHEIDDDNDDSQQLHTIVDKSISLNSSSVVLIDSSDDEVQKPNQRLTMDFDSLPQPYVSTPRPNVLVQPTINAAIRKLPNVNAKGVSQEYYNQNIDRLNHLKVDLEKNRDLLARLGPTLPDRGKNLTYRISKLELDVLKQQNYIETLLVEEDSPLSQPTAAASVVKPISWAEIEKGANAIQSKFTGVVGAMNFAEEREAVLSSLKNAHTELETCPTEDTLAPTPIGLKISLMPHQQYGLAWMMWREKQKHPCGGILADDMGLGKTLSVIALVLAAEEIENAEEEDDEEQSSDDDDAVPEVKANNKWASKGRRSDCEYHFLFFRIEKF